MAALDFTRPVATGLSVGGRIMLTLSHSSEKLSDWYTIRSTQRTLSKLSDRELEDIGLSRGDIEHMGR